jgi:hypothetical protein
MKGIVERNFPSMIGEDRSSSWVVEMVVVDETFTADGRTDSVKIDPFLPD